MKIIAKKVKALYKNGFIQPLFTINDEGDVSIVPKEDYPNNGYIFVSDYDLLNMHFNSELIVMENPFFINNDTTFIDKSNDSNACQKRINFNPGLFKFFSNLSPVIYVPIFKAKFNLEKQRLMDNPIFQDPIFFLTDDNGEFIYGPFERDNYNLKPVTYKNYSYEENIEFNDFLDIYNEYDGSVIFKLNKNELKNSIIEDVDGNDYLMDFSKIISDSVGEVIDFTPLSILHKWVLEKLKNEGIKLPDFISEINNIEELSNSPIDTLKWKNYLEYINRIEERNDVIESLISNLNAKGYIRNNLNENNQKTIQSLEEKISIKNEEIIKLKDQRAEIENQLKEVTSKENEIIDEVLYPNLSSALDNPTKLKEIESLVTEKKEYENIKNELIKLQVKHEILLENIKKSEEIERTINESISKIKQNFHSDVAEHTAKLANAKMYSDLLNGINIDSVNNQESSIRVSKKILNPLPENITNAKLFIIEIQQRLKKLNREMSYNEVANIIITINQSFFTIIAGAPGVGKTSLVNKLSKTYGLNEEFGYLEINCSRGWTSSRDLLGFYNPLTGKFQDSKTRLRYALKQSNENLDAPYIVLLDEANLSPIEHYWSDFIKLADNDYERKIKIYDKEEIIFGKGFRFIATINHDHTTEALSNRLIDRAAIVQIEKPSIVFDNNSELYQIKEIFSFKDIEGLFQETSKWKSDEELIKKLLQQIKDRIESNNSGIVISPRKEIAIKKYCKVATGLLDGNSYVALDFAVAQHILPLISGRGEQFEDMLKLLKSEFSDKGMFKSERLVNKILERGKDLKFFKYVYY